MLKFSSSLNQGNEVDEVLSQTDEVDVGDEKCKDGNSLCKENADAGVQQDVESVVAQRLELMDGIVEAETQHGQRSVRFVALFL
ncbi:hypothetical protein CEXT_41371 [Caerostris extrusa]|uniref:Uncharacterized protein n=1 Tax=Caerostris extrusa TaxID=172846 RepID=A0AAV4P665_CAEEX|nr:hypothetical protein CEXT_41371 [Caerostris extrusa]